MPQGVNGSVGDRYLGEVPSPDQIIRLAATRTVDLTTVGRRSGHPARIEIWWFHVDDRFVITGTPGKRDWYANVLANPEVTIHAPFGDFSGRATIIENSEFRRRVFTDRGSVGTGHKANWINWSNWRR